MRKFLALYLLIAAPAWCQKWNLSYFYDQDGKELRISDFAFPSASHGIAVGAILDADGKKPQFTSVITDDGGAHWALLPLKEYPRSVFFLNDSTGWMVSNESIWSTHDGARTWARIAPQIKPNKRLDDAPDGGLILRLHFLDDMHGFAVGFQKSVFETRDGGSTWQPVAQAASPQGNPAASVYSVIAFAGPVGKIVGGTVPRRDDDDLPDWMVPERSLQKRARPLPAFELSTRDNGATWEASTASVLGSISSLRLARDKGLAVFSYEDSFEFPSDVYVLDFVKRENRAAFRQKNRVVTDAAILTSGTALLAAIEPAGQLRSAPIPGKVRILTSADWSEWKEMPVDYRAVGQRVMLAAPDSVSVWAATDTGMILRLDLVK